MVHCVLWERRPKTAVVWYRDDEVQGVEEFADPAEAEDRAAELRDEMVVVCYVGQSNGTSRSHFCAG